MIKTTKTVMICATSIPKANSNEGNSLSKLLPGSILLK